MSEQGYAGMYSGLVNTIEKKEKERVMAQQKENFDARLVALADKTIEFAEKRGQDDSITVMLTTFLDLALNLKDVMESLSAITDAMSCLTEAIDFIDSVIDFDVSIMDGSLTHNYGFFARWKMRRKMNKTLRNNVGRLKTVGQGLVFKYKLAQGMMDSLSKVSTKLKISMGKTAKVKAKKAKKTGVATGPSPAEKFIAERMAAKGKDIKTDSGTGDGASSGASSYDDVL